MRRFVAFDFLVVLVLSTAGACLRPARGGYVPETFVLRIGEGRVISATGEEIGFRQVTGDSRCPTGVTCVWAGEARVRLWILEREHDSSFVDVVLPGSASRADSSDHVPVDTLGYRIQLLALDPYPKATLRTDASAYRATVSVAILPNQSP